MNSLHDAFDEIVAGVPVYGDLDRAIEQAERERRHQHGTVAAIAAAAAALVVIAGIVAVSRDTDTAPPVSPTPVTPSPTPPKSQSPPTWADTAAPRHDGLGWEIPDPVKAARGSWFAVVAEHLDPTGEHLVPSGEGSFEWPGEGSEYTTNNPADSKHSTYGRAGLMAEHGERSLFDDGCRYLHPSPATNGTEACSTKRFAGPGGEHARISRYGRRCGAYEGVGPAPATCGDYTVAVAVARRDGLIGFVIVDGRGTPEFNPFTRDAMVAAAADPRLTLPEAAYTVPSDRAVESVVEDHFPRYEPDDQTPPATDHPGYAKVWGGLGRHGFSISVRPAGGTPACGRTWLVVCVERRVFGADDPTTVFLGKWNEQDWADVKEPVASTREFVYVGPRHTVVASLNETVEPGEKTLGPERDQRVIDLLLDPRLQ